MKNNRVCNKKFKNILSFLLSIGKIGCIGFGGGSILIPVIEEEVINQKKIDTKEQYDKDVIVASITPGALPVEIAASLGRRNFGYLGMVLGAVMMAFPGALATVFLLTALSVAQNKILLLIEFMTLGVSVFVIFLLTRYICNVQRSFKGKKVTQEWKAVFTMIVVFLLAGGKNLYALLGIQRTPVFSVSTTHILAVIFFFVFYTRSSYTWKHIIIAAVLGGIYLLGKGKAQILNNPYIIRIDELLMLVLAVYGLVSCIHKNKTKTSVEKKQLLRDVGVWFIVFLVFLGLGMVFNPDIIRFVGKSVLSVLLSFGGGDAYLTVAEGLFLDSGLINTEQFFGNIVPIVNILPGSILCKTLAGAGYYAGLNTGHCVMMGIIYALVGFACSIAVSCGFYSIIYYLYDGLIRLNIFQTIAKWIRPIISGLLINIMLSLCNQCIELSRDFGIGKGKILAALIAGYLLDLCLVKVLKGKTTYVLLFNLLTAFSIYLVFFL